MRSSFDLGVRKGVAVPCSPCHMIHKNEKESQPCPSAARPRCRLMHSWLQAIPPPAAALTMPFPPSAAGKTLDLPTINLRALPLHQTKNALVIALPHWGGIAFKWNLFMALAFAAFRRETASCRRKCSQDFWVKLVWQRLQVTVTTPLPRGRRSHALQLGQRKYLYCLRFLKRFFA